MCHVSGLLAAAAVAASSISCGDVVRSGKSPMLLVIDSLQAARGGATLGTFGNPLASDVQSERTTPAPNCTPTSPCATYFNDVGQASFRIVPKDIGTVAVPAAPSTNNEVTITRFHVSYKRADGRNTPGIDVPYPFDGAVTGTVQIGSALTLGFELVRLDAKLEAPLRNLASNDFSILTTIAEVTFYGRDRVGNDIAVTGSIQIDFGNFGG